MKNTRNFNRHCCYECSSVRDTGAFIPAGSITGNAFDTWNFKSNNMLDPYGFHSVGFAAGSPMIEWPQAKRAWLGPCQGQSILLSIPGTILNQGPPNSRRPCDRSSILYCHIWTTLRRYISIKWYILFGNTDDNTDDNLYGYYKIIFYKILCVCVIFVCCSWL